MKTIEIVFKNYSELSKITIGKVFHITPWYNTEQILKSGQINNNASRNYNTPHARYESTYFRNRGYVSLFDYRNPTHEEFEFNTSQCALSKFFEDSDSKASIFILKETEYKKLTTWKDVINFWDGDLIVPNIESGYPSHIDLSAIDKHYIITIMKNKI